VSEDPSAPLHFGLGYRLGSHRGPLPPAFCRACGRPMRLYRRKDGHDGATGEQRYVNVAKCSAPWWRLSFDHDTAEQDVFGDWAWLG
jgi:hypothetical protein